MDRGNPDAATVRAAVTLAAHAPSIQDSQPWQVHLGRQALHLYSDTNRVPSASASSHRELVASCGAALHHLRVAFTAAGWRTLTHRLPNPREPEHLAMIEFHRRPPRAADIAQANAITLRRNDRRPYSSWPIPAGFLELLHDGARRHGTIPRQLNRARAAELSRTIAESSARLRTIPMHGVPIPLPRTPGPGTAAPTLPRTANAAHAGTLLLLATDTDDSLAWLRSGEAASSVLLTATALGLASCPLEFAEARARSRELTGEDYPQTVLRIGWAPVDATPLAPTPRRALQELLVALDAEEAERESG